MTDISRLDGIDVKRSVIDSVLAGLCALIVFGPIVGIVLKGYSFTLSPQRVFVLVAVVMAGRLLLSLLLQTRGGSGLSDVLKATIRGYLSVPRLS